MDECDCCLLGCLCGACCASAMGDDDRRRRDYHAPPVYVQPVVVTSATYPAYPMTAYPAQATYPPTTSGTPTGPYYQYTDPTNTSYVPYPAYPAQTAYPPQTTYPPPTKY